MNDNKHILDDFDFVNNLVIGEYVWSGKPDLLKTPSFKKLRETLIYLFSFIAISVLGLYLILYLFNVELTIHLYFLVFSFVYIVFVMRLIWQGYQFFQISRSSYVITETHIARLVNKEKVIYQKPLTHIYQIILVDVGNEIGSILMKIKSTPSKKKKIKISKKMNFPNLSFEGIKDYQKIADLILEKRNNAMNTLDWNQLTKK